MRCFQARVGIRYEPIHLVGAYRIFVRASYKCLPASQASDTPPPLPPPPNPHERSPGSEALRPAVHSYHLVRANILQWNFDVSVAYFTSALLNRARSSGPITLHPRRACLPTEGQRTPCTRARLQVLKSRVLASLPLIARQTIVYDV